MINDLKIGKKVYGISIQNGAWASKAKFYGQIVSFDESTIVLWASEPDHNGEYDPDYIPYRMMFVENEDKTNLYETEKEMLKELKNEGRR